MDWVLFSLRFIIGGNIGFDKKIWSVVEHRKGANAFITFKYVSKDGEEGYPGSLVVTATYTLTGSTTMRLDMEAIPENKPTPVSLAQHTYWNLAGHKSGHILDHTIQIWGQHITPVDEYIVLTGEIRPVKNTPVKDLLTTVSAGEQPREQPQ